MSDLHGGDFSQRVRLDMRVDLDLVAIGQRLREAREAANVGSNALCRAIDTSNGWVSKIERGEGSPDISAAMLASVAATLGVRLEWLLTGAEPKMHHDVARRAELKHGAVSVVHISNMPVFGAAAATVAGKRDFVRALRAVERVGDRWVDARPSEATALRILELIEAAFEHADLLVASEATQTPQRAPMAVAPPPSSSRRRESTMPAKGLSEVPAHSTERPRAGVKAKRRAR